MPHRKLSFLTNPKKRKNKNTYLQSYPYKEKKKPTTRNHGTITRK